MAEFTQELIFHEVLKQIQSDMVGLKDGQREHSAAMNAFRTHMVALQQDVSNIYAILVRHENRLDRIERRLKITEAPA
jgi:septal ring factor EnvC (AmiA/AmiB activator)